MSEQLILLMTRTEFALKARTSRPNISQMCHAGLKDCMIGDKINAAHPKAVAYLKKRKSYAEITIIESAAKIEAEKTRELKKARPAPAVATKVPEDEPLLEGGNQNVIDAAQLPKDIRQLVDWPLRKILERFGTVYELNDYLNASKRVEDLYERRLKNVEKEKKLIPRDFVTVHIMGAVETIFARLLNDAPRTVTTRIVELAAADEPRENIEEACKQILSTQIKTIKSTILRELKNVGN